MKMFIITLLVLLAVNAVEQSLVFGPQKEIVNFIQNKLQDGDNELQGADAELLQVKAASDQSEGDELLQMKAASEEGEGEGEELVQMKAASEEGEGEGEELVQMKAASEEGEGEGEGDEFVQMKAASGEGEEDELAQMKAEAGETEDEEEIAADELLQVKQEDEDDLAYDEENIEEGHDIESAKATDVEEGTNNDQSEIDQFLQVQQDEGFDDEDEDDEGQSEGQEGDTEVEEIEEQSMMNTQGILDAVTDTAKAAANKTKEVASKGTDSVKKVAGADDKKDAKKDDAKKDDNKEKLMFMSLNTDIRSQLQKNTF